MPPLSTLLEVQELDLATDRLLTRRRTLPEREALESNRQRGTALDSAHDALVARRGELGRAEHTLGQEVATVAAKAKEVQDVLYSGTVKAPKELEALQEELRLLKEKQSEIEGRELELLEAIEEAENASAANRSARSEADDEAESLTATILGAEAEIDSELATLGGQRATAIAGVPDEITAAYDRLRGNQRLAGRAAVLLNGDSCVGCRLKIPSMEYKRMKKEPEDALIRCPHCSRVLVR